MLSDKKIIILKKNDKNDSSRNTNMIWYDGYEYKIRKLRITEVY